MRTTISLPRRPQAYAALPTLLTLGNAVCGFGAVTAASGWTGPDPTGALLAAGVFIYLAMLFDGLDGAAARWAGQSSEFGARLDSLCDAISFGAAPALLVVELSRPHGYQPRVVWAVAALYVACAVLRLARFGLDHPTEREPGVFLGLPTPGAAAVLASVPVLLYGPRFLEGGSRSEPLLESWVTGALPGVTLAVSALMVSRLRYGHMFRRLVGGRRSRPLLVLLVFTAAGVAAAPRVAVPALACWYAFGPPLRAVWNRCRSVAR